MPNKDPVARRAVARARYLRQREEILAASAARYASNPEKHKAHARAHYQRNAVEIKRKSRFARHGLTPEQYEEMLVAQAGRCALCGELLTGKTFIDHDHTTGKVRGVLHPRCNIGLAYIEDRCFAQQAETYLKENKTWT